MDTHSFSKSLRNFESEFLELTWEQGRNPRCSWDGGHFAIPGTPRPLSVSKCEARLLANLVILENANSILEIGTAFGYSAAWLAYGLSNNGLRGRLYTIDDYSEGDHPDKIRGLAQNLWRTTQLDHLIELKVGRSPEVLGHGDVPSIDLAFIDGEHRKHQPLIDYRAVVEFMSEDGLIVFHDAQIKYDVNEAVEAAKNDGFEIVRLGTSCEPAIALRHTKQRWSVETALRLAKAKLLIGNDGWPHP